MFSSWTNASQDWWPFPAIWTVNEQREESRSGIIGWPQNFTRAFQSEPYEKGRSFRKIVDKMLLWFNDPDAPINFGAIYFDQPGATGQTGTVFLS